MPLKRDKDTGESISSLNQKSGVGQRGVECGNCKQSRMYSTTKEMSSNFGIGPTCNDLDRLEDTVLPLKLP